MYDSDEVRDAVRRDMRRIIWSPVDLAALDRIEWPALRDARANYGHQLTEALKDYARLTTPAVTENWLMSVAAFGQEYLSLWPTIIRRQIEAVMDELRPLVDEVTEALRRVGEIIRWGIPDEIVELIKGFGKQGPGSFIWQRRGRVPDVRPARGVDAVAAGRSPAMVMRTRIRGGRR